MSSKIKIQKGISPPGRMVGRKPTYPLFEMSVGDSFFVEAFDQTREQNRIFSAASYVSKKNGWKFITRQLKENGKTGVRCWRIK